MVRLLVALILALLAATGCGTTRYVRLHMALRTSDRELVIDADETTDPPQVTQDGDAFTVAMSHHVLRIERTRLLVDEAEVAPIAPEARSLSVRLDARRLVVRADGVTIHELEVDD